MERNEFDEIVENMSKPKYAGIDGFFAVLAVLIITLAVPVNVMVWRWAF